MHTYTLVAAPSIYGVFRTCSPRWHHAHADFKEVSWHLHLLTLATLCSLSTAVSTPLCQSARLLSGHFNDDIGDPSGYSAQAMARSMDAASSKNRQAITPFDAEATANSAFSGVYRAASDVHRATYATVEADPIGNNPDRRRETIQPRARWAWRNITCCLPWHGALAACYSILLSAMDLTVQARWHRACACVVVGLQSLGRDWSA